MNITSKYLALLITVLSQAGCVAVANLDRFDFDEGGGLCTGTNASPLRDLRFSMRDMPHLNRHTEIRVINTSGAHANRMEALAIYEGLPARELTLVMQNAIAEGSYRVDFWCDASNDNGVLDMFDSDHSWSADGVTVDSTHTGVVGTFESGCFRFDHNSSFAPLLDTALFPVNTSDGRRDLQIVLGGYEAFGAEALELRVVIPNTVRRTIGFFRYQQVNNDPDINFTLPGLVVAGDPYDLEVYIDANNNLTYDADEHSWLIEDVMIDSDNPIVMAHRPVDETPLSI